MIANAVLHWFTSWVFGLGGIGGVIAIVAWVLWYFTPGFLLQSKNTVLMIAIGATVFTVAASYFYTSGYKTGYDTAIAHIASQNKEASDAVKKAVSNVQRCIDSGGEWDSTRGVCQ